MTHVNRREHVPYMLPIPTNLHVEFTHSRRMCIEVKLRCTLFKCLSLSVFEFGTNRFPKLTLTTLWFICKLVSSLGNEMNFFYRVRVHFWIANAEIWEFENDEATWWVARHCSAARGSKRNPKSFTIFNWHIVMSPSLPLPKKRETNALKNISVWFWTSR